MGFMKLTAIVRRSRLEDVEKALVEKGVSGLTVQPITGFGEYKNFFADDPKVRHLRVEVVTSAERVDEFVAAIQGSAHTGASGDGLITVEPVDRVVRIRTGEDARSRDLHEGCDCAPRGAGSCD